jgi:hypothetical protein
VRLGLMGLTIAGFFICSIALTACGAGTGGLGGFEDDPFNLKVENDTVQTVLIGACNGYNPSCSSLAYSLKLNPGGSSSTEQDPDGIFRPMKVTSESGATLGCLPFRFDRVTPTIAIVEINQMVPCGNSLGERTSGGRDWPFSRY